MRERQICRVRSRDRVRIDIEWHDEVDDDDDDGDEELTDEEKDALDYQLQRAMDMVRAMSKLQARASIVPATPDDPIAMEIDVGDDSAKSDDKKSDDKKTDKK